MSVAASQRFTGAVPCIVCLGHAGMARHKGCRCYGYMSSDGQYARCSRPEFAGAILPGPDGLYGHRLSGDCRCGVAHGGPTRVRLVANAREDK